MPRGFKVDHERTQHIFNVKRWRPGMSFISQPKIIKGECTEPKPHLILIGEDKGPIRAEVFRRNREAHSGLNRCAGCGFVVSEQDTYGERLGHWHHIRNKAGERCDCPENGQVLCNWCHKQEHPQVQFGKSKIVSETA